MAFGSRWRGLRAKIIAWSFVPTALVLLAVALVLYSAYQQVTAELVIERDQELTRLSANQLAGLFVQPVDTLTAVSRIVAPLIASPEDAQVALHDSGNRLVTFDGGTVILDAHGTVVASEPPGWVVTGQDWSGRAYFQTMARAPGVWFSDIVSDGIGGAEVVVLAVPVINNRGQFSGVAAGMFRLRASSVSAFYGNIVRLRVSESGLSYLVDGNGRVIYHPESERIGQDFSNQEVVREVIAGRVGAVRTRDVESRDIVAAYAPVPNTTWGLVTQEDWAVLAGASLRYQRFLVALLALGVIAPALVVMIAVRRITGPLSQLIEASRQVAGGNFQQVIDIRTGDELETLAEQFNQMSAELRDSYAHLEQRVARRTGELAALNAIVAVVSRSLKIDEILHTALDKTLESLAMDAGIAYRLGEDGQTLHAAAHRNVSPAYFESAQDLPLEDSLAGHAIRAGRVVVVQVEQLPPGGLRTRLEAEGMEVAASVPLAAKGRILGSISVGTRRTRLLMPEEISLLEGIGQQVGVAMENARLFEAARQAESEALTLARIASNLTFDQSLDVTLSDLAQNVVQATGAAACAVLITRGKPERLAITGAYGLPDAYVQALEQSWAAEATTVDALMQRAEGVGLALKDGRSVLVVGARRQMADDPFYAPLGDLMQQMVWDDIVAMPLTFREERIGLLMLYYPAGESPAMEDDQPFLRAVADQAAVAVENARLFTLALDKATLEERQRLARDLHDSVTQSLYSLTLLAEAGRRLAKTGDFERVTAYLGRLGETAQQALKEMRLLVYELRPLVLETEGLVGALQQRLDAVEKRAGVDARLLVEGPVIHLTPAVEQGLYRIGQEALNNALKHAKASQVTVHLSAAADAIVFEVADNGAGFDAAATRDRGGLGMTSMAQRAERLGGTVTVDSQPGQGTRIRVRIETAPQAKGNGVREAAT